MAGAARAVRIPRSGQPSGGADSATAVTELPVPSASPRRRYANSGGSSRAYRTFLFFLVALAVIYGVFIGIAVRTAAAGTNSDVEAILTIAVAVALVVGWFVTLGQTPSMAWKEGNDLVVLDRVGHARRYPANTVRIRVLRSNGAGLFGPEPTEYVELSIPAGRPHTYLVSANFFDFAK